MKEYNKPKKTKVNITRTLNWIEVFWYDIYLSESSFIKMSFVSRSPAEIFCICASFKKIKLSGSLGYDSWTKNKNWLSINVLESNDQRTSIIIDGKNTHKNE